MSLPGEPTQTGSRTPWTLQPRDRRLADVLTGALAYARGREYAGWGTGGSRRCSSAVETDGESNLEAAVWTLARRTPLDLRPYVLGSRRRTVEAAALFAMANQVAHWLDRTDPTAVDAPDDTDYLEEAEQLGEWLRENTREDGVWGVTGGGSERSDDAVDVAATSAAGRALVRTVFVDPEHVEVAREAGVTLAGPPDVLAAGGTSGGLAGGDGSGGLRGASAFSDLDRGVQAGEVAVDVAALGARLLVDLYGHLGEPWLLDAAEDLLDHVANQQAARGGWTDADGQLGAHRTGAVVEAFQRHEAVTGQRQYEDVLADALHFYQRILFGPDGAPNAHPERPYPRRVQAAAQGVVVFATEGDYEFVHRVLDWTMDNLYAGDGRFHAHKQRLRTRRQVRMGRCQAWMAYAIAEYLRCRYIDAGEADGSTSV
jgi:hypothetical protein